METRDKTRPNEQLITRLRALIDARPGMSARSLSRAIGANVAYVGQILSGKGGTPSAAKLHRIAEVLGTTTDFILGTVEGSEQPHSEVSFREELPRFSGKPDDRIPVRGTAFCDDLAIQGEDGTVLSIERLLLDIDHTIRLIERPPALWNARDAYAIYFHGSSMEPRFYQGEIGVVDPRRPPSPNDFVVAQLNNGQSEDIITVLVKQLVRVTSAWVELRQFNPPQTFRIPRSQVAHLHRLCNNNELLGG